MRKSRRHPRLRLSAIIAPLRLRAAAGKMQRPAHLREHRPKNKCADRRNFDLRANACRPIAGDRRRLGVARTGLLSRRWGPLLSGREAAESIIMDRVLIRNSRIQPRLRAGRLISRPATAGGSEGSATAGEGWESPPLIPAPGGGSSREFFRGDRWPPLPRSRYRSRVSVPPRRIVALKTGGAAVQPNGMVAFARSRRCFRG